MRGIVNKIAERDFIDIIKSSYSWLDAASKCGFKKKQKYRAIRQENKQRIQKRCNQLGISTTHLKDGFDARWKKRDNLQKNRRPTYMLRKKLQKSNRLEICEICRCENLEYHEGNWMWQGKPLQMQIDHIKGIIHDDSDDVEFLRYVCANCHSQTANCCHSVKSYHDPVTRKTHGKILLNSTREYICTNCRCVDMTFYNRHWHWRDWPIKLECNHINGHNIPEPNSIENLEWLCPSCHSQHTQETRQKRHDEAKNKKITGRSLDYAEEAVVEETHNNVIDENKTDKAVGNEPVDF